MKKQINKAATVKRDIKSTIQKLEAVRTKYCRGDFSRIARLTGYDVSHVSRVIAGTSKNPNGRIAEMAYRMASQRKTVKA